MLSLARLLVCLFGLVALGAAKPDPRVAQLRAWTTAGYVVAMTEKDDTAIVDVGPKWTLLPLDRQTSMASTIAGLVHDREELDQVTIEKQVNDPNDLDHEPLLLGRSTIVDARPFVAWEDWYAREVRRREFARK